MGRGKQPHFAARQDQGLAMQIRNDFEIATAKLNQGDTETALILFKQLLQKAQPRLPGYDAIVQNLATAYKRRIDKLVRDRADVAVTSQLAQEAMSLELRGNWLQDKEMRGHFADVFHNIALIFNRNTQYAISLPLLRKAISIEPCPTYYVSLANALAYTKEPARLSDYTTAYRSEELGKHIFIACAPKSGSTFLKNVMVALTKFRPIFSVFAALQNEHELDLPIWVKFGKTNTVTQQHCRASEANIQVMQAFGIRPVVLVRNIYDTTISLRDFYRTGFVETTYYSRKDFDNSTEEQQTDLIIDNVLPWYFQFISSWQRAEADRRLEVHWLRYEDMIRDKAGTAERLLKLYGLSADRATIEHVVATTEGDTRRNRFNKGVAGRGELLSASQKARIAALARHYPSADFSCVGL
ncbi:MAG: sulfotransferase domain-containing protein [Acidobacteria bacterium]|nr:sulfotransferase domain-containing protein [Acidobacteriota bacterium]